MTVTEERLRKALQEDFEALYVNEYATDYETKRVIRNIEISIMRLENTMRLLNS